LRGLPPEVPRRGAIAEYREDSRESRELREPSLRASRGPFVDVQRQANMEEYYSANTGSRVTPPPERYPVPPAAGGPPLRRDDS